jgi:UV DNA damage repair endonuclease
MYRFSSALAPYATHPALARFHGQVTECEEQLARCGELARTLGI